MANNALLDALGQLGSGAMNALSAPGDYARGLISGTPGERVTGHELLRRWGKPFGIQPDDGLGGALAGMGASIATDPLTIALPLGAAAAVKYAPGALAAARAGAQGVANAARTGVKAVGTGIDRALGAMADTKAAEYLGNTLSRALSAPKIGGLAHSGAMPARRSVFFLKNAGTPAERVVGGLKSDKTLGQRIRGVMKSVDEDMSTTRAGFYSPRNQGGAIYKPFDDVTSHPLASLLQKVKADIESPPGWGSVGGLGDDEIKSMADAIARNVTKHENVHALIDRAVRTGEMSHLPLGWRAVANAERSKSELLRSLGHIGNEAAAQSVYGDGAWKFLNQPNQHYVDLWAEHSPLMAAIYGNRVIPKAIVGTAAGAGLLGAGAVGGTIAANQFGR